MKIEIAEAGGKQRTIRVPLFKSLSGIVAWAMNKNRKTFLDHINSNDLKEHLTEDEVEDVVEEGINTMQEHIDNLPSKKELKEFFSKSIEILKEHKGLVLVEVADHEGDHIKITL